VNEHKYLTPQQISGLRADVDNTPDVNGYRLLRALDDIEALRAELKAAQEDIAQLKTQLHQTEIERNMASDCVKADGEEIARLREELCWTQVVVVEERNCLKSRALNPQPAQQAPVSA